MRKANTIKNIAMPTLWTNRNGELERVFLGRQRGVAGSVPGDPAPGVEDGFFFFPGIAEIDDNGTIIVVAFVETSNDIFESTLGIWINADGEFEPVAFEGGPVPGMPGTTFLLEQDNVRGITSFQMDRNGTITYIGKFLCDGDPAFAEPIRVVMTKDEDRITVDPSTEVITIGSLVSISRNGGRKFGAETKLDIRQGNDTLQALTIHTSCSKPLAVGDQFGSLILREFIPEN